jgi:alpha-2-macroglobulin
MVRTRILLLFIALIAVAACRREPATPTPTLVPERVAGVEPAPPAGSPFSWIADSGALPRPRVIGRQPAAGQELAVDAPLEIHFDQPMDAARTTAAWSLLDPEGQVVTGAVSFPQPRILRFQPGEPLQMNTVYHALVGATAASSAGLTVVEGLSLSFNTTGELAVSQTSPVNGTRDVAVNATITVVFNRPVVPLLTAGEQARLPSPLHITPAVAGQGEWVNTSVYVFRPATALQGKTRYTVDVLADAVNEAGPAGSILAEDVSWSFTTAAPTYSQFELVDSRINPAPNSTLLLLDQAFRIRFDQAMDRASTEAAVSLRPAGGGNPINLDFSWDDRARPLTLTFTPTQLLALDSRYQVSLATSAQAAGGGELGRGLNWQGRTVPAPDVASTRYEYGTFTIRFAGPVAFNSLKDKVQFDPPLADKESGFYSDYNHTWNFYGFAPSTTYSVRILPGIGDRYGNVMAAEYTTSFTTPDAWPYAQFGFPYGLILLRQEGPTDLYVTHRNVEQLDVALYRLAAPDLTGLMFGSLDSCGYTPAEELWQTSRQVSRPLNEVGYARFDLAPDGQPPVRGLYFAGLDSPQLQKPGHCRRTQGSILAVVNANVTLKTTTTEALVWLTDLETAEPLPGIPVSLYDTSMTKVAQGVTGGNGLVYWDNLKLAPGYEAQYLALTESDEVFGLAFTGWSDAVYPYAFGISYYPYSEPAEPAVYVYTDRPLYRPGQPVAFKGIVRLNDDLLFSLPAFNTVQVTISSFDQVVFAEELPLSAHGSFTGQITLDGEATLGSYSIAVRHGPRDIGYGAFDVAEYRKPTFQVTVSGAQEHLLVGDDLEATVEAAYFAGGGLAQAEVTWTVHASHFSFRPGSHLSPFSFGDRDQDTGYYFYDDYAYRPVEIVASGTGTIDSQGRFSVSVPTGLLAGTEGRQLTFEATVSDPAGNAVSGRTAVIVHPAKVYAGIRSASRVSSAGESASLEIALVDWAAQPVAGRVDVALFERRWSSVQEEDARGQLIWRSQVEETLVDERAGVVVSGQGRATVTFMVPEGGVYKARVTARDDAGNMQQAATTFWVAGEAFIPWRRGNDNNFDLIADRDSYRPGETAELLIASPFQGDATALVTVERGHIKQRQVLRLSGNSTVYRLPISGDMAPNVVVSVLVIKGSDAFNPIPAFKVGMVDLAVARNEQELLVSVTPDKSNVGPGDSVSYAVQVSDHAGTPVAAELSLALADLAALSLSARREPSLLDFFYARRYLSVSTALLLNRLIDLFNLEIPPEDSGGADGKGGFADFGVERIRQNFPDTAYWEGQLQTDAGGLATVTVTLPDNLTTWRMDVRAVTVDTRVGQATVDIVASKPLRLQPHTPRFFVAGDQVQLGALVINTTAAPIEAHAILGATGATLLDAAVQPVTVPAHGEVYVIWQAAIDPAASRVDLVFHVEGGGYSDGSTPPMATLPEGGLPVYRYEVSERTATSGLLAGAGAVVESVDLPVYPEWEISQAQVTVSLAPSLAAAMTGGLSYLEHFPYECTEQTVSRFLPNVLSGRALREAGMLDPALEAGLQEQVTLAMQRLYSRQRRDGGWPWWERGESDALVTAYVVLGMVEAREAGYTVSEGTLTAGRNYLQRNWRSTRLPAGPTRYNREAFLLYVLARSGGSVARPLADLYDNRNALGIYGRGFLTQAIHLMDPDDPRLETLVADLYSQAIVSAGGTHWEETSPDRLNWNTDTRTTAIVLAALARLQPESPLVANAARWLMAHRTSGRWQGTQETAWALMALTQYMVTSGELQADYGYEVALNGVLIGSGQANSQSLRQTLTLELDVADLLQGELNRLAIGRSAGGGNLYYTAQLEAAVPVTAVQALDRGVMISRRYFRAEDPETPITEAAQGESFLARLTLIAPHSLHYLMVEDYLPAGLETIDSSLQTSQQAGAPTSFEWNRYLIEGWGWWVFDHVELRDEKVVLSAAMVPAGTYEYVYRVRAAVPGVFQVIPPSAWELYFPEVSGRGDGSVFTVCSGVLPCRTASGP